MAEIISSGCTVINSITVPFTKDELKACKVYYQQNKLILIEKDMNELVFSNGKISINLSQEETMKFKENTPIKIQVRAKYKDNTSIKSNVIEVYTDELLKKEVI